MVSLFSVLILVSSLALIISVTMQEGSSEGLGTIGGESSSLFGQTRGSSREDILRRITAISAVVFLISNLVLSAVK